MASKNKTPVFGLNQWDANDSVLREDFNADNLKTEAGLNAAIQAVEAAEQNVMQAVEAAEQSAIQAANTAEANAKAASVPTSRTVNGKALSSNITLAKADVGLSNVDNTSDANKPVSTATQNALNLKANLASPALTGNPTAPTQAAGNNSTRIATTAFVTSATAAASVLVKLATITTAQAVDSVSIDLSGFDLSQYRSLKVHFAIDGTNLQNLDYLLLRINGDAQGDYVQLETNTSSNNQSWTYHRLGYMGTEGGGGVGGFTEIYRAFTGLVFNSYATANPLLIGAYSGHSARTLRSGGIYRGCGLSDVQNIQVYAENQNCKIAVGSRFDVYGIK